jgi:hypothetical protein
MTATWSVIGPVEAWMASMVDKTVFLMVMSRLASNPTGTRLQRINVVLRFKKL